MRELANIAFVHLSSEHTGAAQLGWLQNLVNAAKSSSGVDWMISLCHRPYNAEQYIGDISGWLRTTAMPVLAETEKHVLNIGAHHHFYARGQTREWPIYHIIAEGNVKLPAATRWSYNSRLIDQFHRKRGVVAPETPALTHVVSGEMTLPLELVSTGYVNGSGEPLNSTWSAWSPAMTFGVTGSEIR